MKLNNLNNFAVFGLSFGGRQFVRKCIEYGYKIKLIIDNDKEKDGKKFCNIPILLPEKAIKKKIEIVYLIGRYIKEQKQQLLNYGFPKNKIFYVPRKDIEITGNFLNQRNKITLSYLKTISEVCTSIDIQVWLIESGLLSAARNQGLGSLSDFDLMLFGKQKTSFLLKKLINARSDWIIRNYYTSKNLDQLGTVIMSSELTEIVEPAVIDLKGLNTNPLLIKYPNLIENHFKNSFKNLEKTNIKYPNDYEKYLKILYGSNWQIPEDFFKPRY